ncbi:hypothetical protein Acr_24g0016110 [Actinidia rufa]|uniref:Uncharacterized protein n=1 Tax=Actinidia rufa TaxID=165716 RepID=A0A7J0GXD7_9ERIC|nr:hypothetical protein Acr_24g0016110 [Actinidia rufa]
MACNRLRNKILSKLLRVEEPRDVRRVVVGFYEGLLQELSLAKVPSAVAAGLIGAVSAEDVWPAIANFDNNLYKLVPSAAVFIIFGEKGMQEYLPQWQGYRFNVQKD